MVLFRCQAEKEFGISEAGQFGLKLTYKQTLQQKTHELATLMFNVVEVRRGSRNKPTITYRSDHDMRMSVATIEEGAGGGWDTNTMVAPFNEAFAAASDELGFATFRAWFKNDKKNTRRKLRCFYGDKKVGESGDFGNTYSFWRRYKSGFTGFGKKGEPDVNVRWEQAVFRANGLLFRRDPNWRKDEYADAHPMNENPGDYRCVITGDGDILKELHFTIGEDGNIQRPSCQDQSMKTMRHITLVRQVNEKVSTIDYDDSIGRKFGYFGNAKWAGDCPLIE